MQYCTECHSIEQGTILTEGLCHCGGMRELCCNCNSTGIKTYEICSQCESNSVTEIDE